jgi:hypothetical protein
MTPRPDLASYERSAADWPRLLSYAKRVAAQTTLKPLQDSESFAIQKTRQVPVKGFFRTKYVTETYQESGQRAVGPEYWVLERRHWARKQKHAHMIDESYEWVNYRLHVDGSLVVSHETWDEITLTPGGWSRYPSSWSHRPLDSDDDLAIFDFESKYHHSAGKIAVDTNSNPDRSRLKYHAKGVGLSLALKRILEGR